MAAVCEIAMTTPTKSAIATLRRMIPTGPTWWRRERRS